VDPPIEALTPYQTEQIALTLMQGNRRLIYDYLTGGSCDCSYSLGDEARFRVNIFRQQGHFSIVLRKLQGEIPTVASLGLPAIFTEIAKEKTGLVLITGATGSGKTTTLAALLNEINVHQPVHVVTLEDPIEFVHPTLKATFNQRELGHDFNNYPNGLRAALRQAPKVILVGEMRDRATVEVAMMAAETGHLVLSTLHTSTPVRPSTVSSVFFPWEKNNNCASACRIPCVISSASDSRRKLEAAGNYSQKFLGTICAPGKPLPSVKASTAASTKSSRRVRLRMDDVRPVNSKRLRTGPHYGRNR
jgi:pilus retraction protein PilT